MSLYFWTSGCHMSGVIDHIVYKSRGEKRWNSFKKFTQISTKSKYTLNHSWESSRFHVSEFASSKSITIVTPIVETVRFLLKQPGLMLKVKGLAAVKLCRDFATKRVFPQKLYLRNPESRSCDININVIN